MCSILVFFLGGGSYIGDNVYKYVQHRPRTQYISGKGLNFLSVKDSEALVVLLCFNYENISQGQAANGGSRRTSHHLSSLFKDDFL